MRRLLSILMTSCLLVLPGTTASAEPRFALRGEGYVGYTNLEVVNSEEDAFQGGGTGSASAVFDSLYLQADVFGDVTDFDGAKSELVGAGGHLGWRDAERGSFGAAGTYNRQDLGDTDLWRAGLEGEIFIDRLSLAAMAGYAEAEDDGAIYLDFGAMFYPTDRVRLDVRGGAYEIEDDDPIGTAGAGGEFLFSSFAAGFVRWEASFFDSGFLEIDQHSIVAGLRLYWGADEPSLVAYDRAHFKKACGGLVLLGRYC